MVVRIRIIYLPNCPMKALRKSVSVSGGEAVYNNIVYLFDAHQWSIVFVLCDENENYFL